MNLKTTTIRQYGINRKVVITLSGFVMDLEEIKNKTPENFKYSPLWYHKKNLMQTVSGFGKKLTTSNKVCVNNRWYRVYCHCFSNCGTLYIISNGVEYNI